MVVARLLVLSLLLTSLSACGGPQGVGRSSVRTDGSRIGLPGMRASVQVPKGFEVVDDRTWVQKLGQDRGVILRVHQQPEPPEGADRHVDKLIQDLEKQGEAGVETDRTVPLGDLDGRLVQAIELRRRPPAALWLVVAVAEDGLYTVSVAGPADELRKRRTEFEGFLQSLRVLQPAGPPVPRDKPIEDDLLPPEGVTPS